MADQETTTAGAAARLPSVPLSANPVVRQLGVLIGIALSVALGIVIVLWSWTPNYSLLFGNLTQKDASEVVAALQQANIEYKVDENTGAVMVKSQNLHDARMKLASQGLPRGSSLGFELLQQETGFGTSRAVEAARFHRALEGELARTISTLASVQTARVHLATPKKSVFVRQKRTPSASVVVKLAPGRTLEKGQVAAVIHMVASSVPDLQASKVTVVDQRGNLLSGDMDTREMMLTANQFEYTKQLEEHYQERVEEILRPILGADNVRAQVTADVDFTITEQTEERFNPDLPALRSEQVNEQTSSQGAVAGVPGAISNQPGAGGTAPQTGAGAAGGEESAGPLNTSKRATRNYELDKTISHTRLSSGTLRRLSVAVVVDDHVTTDDQGATTRRERTPEEVSRITQLVREAIGFNAQRGDSVRVVNAAFQVPPAPEELPEIPLMEQAWVWDLAKQVGGFILVLVLIFVVLLPTLKKLTTPQPMAAGAFAGAGAAGGGMVSMEGGYAGAEGGMETAEGGRAPVKLPGPGKYEDTLDAARQLVNEDPMRVAQVVKSWVSEDGR
jgi:flagellar M-ring protein FliF